MENPSLYPEAPGVLAALREKGVPMAVASWTPTPDTARSFLNKLNITDHFVNMQIDPIWSHKVVHFQKILQSTDVPYKDVRFFDDDDRNICSVSQAGCNEYVGQQQRGLESAYAGSAATWSQSECKFILLIAFRYNCRPSRGF